MSTDDVRRAYSALAAPYIDLLGHVDVVDPADRAFVADAFAGVNGPILDVGCGPGHLSGLLGNLGHRVVGVDPVPEFVAHARRTHTRVPFVRGAVDALPLADASLAGVLALYSLIHLSPDEVGAALARLYRALVPVGVLVVGLFHAATTSTFPHRVTPATAWPRDEIETRLDRAGFTPQRWETRPATTAHRAHLAVCARRRPQAI